jgi:hypothetical protein
MKHTRPRQLKAEKKMNLPNIKVNYSILVPGFDMIRKHNESPIFRISLTDEGYQVMALLERMSSTEIISSISIVGSTFQIILVYFYMQNIIILKSPVLEKTPHALDVCAIVLCAHVFLGTSSEPSFIKVEETCESVQPWGMLWVSDKKVERTSTINLSRSLSRLEYHLKILEVQFNHVQVLRYSLFLIT